MSEFYCPEHEYNPPPNSGFAFCPQCELKTTRALPRVVEMLALRKGLDPDAPDAVVIGDRPTCADCYEIGVIRNSESPKLVDLCSLHAGVEKVCSDAVIDEVQRRMDAVVDAAVEWHQAGREGAEWFDKAEILETAIDSLLELRGQPNETALGRPDSMGSANTHRNPNRKAVKK